MTSSSAICRLVSPRAMCCSTSSSRSVRGSTNGCAGGEPLPSSAPPSSGSVSVARSASTASQRGTRSGASSPCCNASDRAPNCSRERRARSLVSFSPAACPSTSVSNSTPRCVWPARRRSSPAPVRIERMRGTKSMSRATSNAWRRRRRASGRLSWARAALPRPFSALASPPRSPISS